MAELCIKIKRDKPSKYEDGDIIFAPNNRRIKDVHAQVICHPKKMGFNGDGLRIANCLLDTYKSKVMQYKFQRVSAKEIKRITLATMDEEIISDVPNAKKEAIDVPLFVARRLRSDRHQIFGTKGSEYWYGGHTDASLAKLAPVWAAIESKTAYREADHTKWPFTEGELKNYLCVAVDDFDNETRGDLESPLTDDKDPENIVTLKHRKHKVDWQNLALSTVIKDSILAKGVKVDIRDSIAFARSVIVGVKS